MSKCEKHCNTCDYPYQAIEPTETGAVVRQRYASPDYNSPNYTHEMFMEDRARNYCRFWTPKQKGFLS